MPAEYRYIKTSAAQLERFGLRAEEALVRHGDSSPWFLPFKPTLPGRVAVYVAQLAGVRRLEPLAREHTRRAHEAVGALARDMRGYFVAVKRDVPAFARRDYPETKVRTDLVQQSRHFANFVRSYRNQAGQPLPYARQLVARQTALAEHAAELDRAAGDAMAELTARRRELHEGALALHAELVAFRQVLRKVLGGEHRDYRALCRRRVVQEVQADSAARAAADALSLSASE